MDNSYLFLHPEWTDVCILENNNLIKRTNIENEYGSYKIEKYSHHTSEREDPILIQIYHELKEKINGKYSNIEITLVNNKYKDCYNIEDYDGNEYIRIDYGYYKYKKLINNIKNIINNDNDPIEKIDAIKLLIK